MIKGTVGGTFVKVQLVEGDGGSFYLDNGLATMQIGVDCYWHRCVGTLLHESMEMAMMLNNNRLQRGPHVTDSDYCFFMEHEQFTRVADEAGYFIAEVIPQITADYNEIHGLRGKKRVGVV